ncbi:hypothetical protein [Microbacterium sp. 13-71-7]|uniref:hypothetical protein n=1 Tax=Microbacterium sp. 13-71-7 TaxID=1970399 RepID=UPI000BCE6F91|nr:hypothetical protein [Microbacterium sp. 13-71-7]OZB81695.1 MAG: hypothetical protein B7X32_16020 [Microbacterium sp. 13-71-7]
MLERPSGSPLSTFRPLGLGVRTGAFPVNVGWPFPCRLSIYREGLSFRLLGAETWIPHEEIEMILRGPGQIRVIWSNNGANASATASDWFRVERLVAALEEGGYRILGA